MERLNENNACAPFLVKGKAGLISSGKYEVRKSARFYLNT